MQIQSVAIQQPMALSGHQSKTVQVVLKPQADSPIAYQFEIFSLDEQTSVWTRHAVGSVAALTSTMAVTAAPERAELAEPPQPTASLDPSLIKTQYNETLPSAQLYQRFRRQSMDYGASFRGIRQLHRSETQALGEIALPDGVVLSGYCLHPALLDACFQVLGVLVSPEENAAYLPVSIEQLSVTGTISGPLWSRVELLTDNPATDSARASSRQTSRRQLIANIAVFDADGQPVAEIQKLTLKRVPQKVLQRVLQQESPEDWLYRLDWQPLSLPPAPESLSGQDHWLVFCAGGADGVQTDGVQADGVQTDGVQADGVQADGAQAEVMGTAALTDHHLLSAMRTAGATYTQITMGKCFEEISETHFQIDPTNPIHYAQLLATLPPIHGVVHSWGTAVSGAAASNPASNPAPNPAALSATELQQSQQYGCGSVLHLTQALTTGATPLPGGLWLLTHGACAVGNTALALQPQQGSLWGLGRVIALEHPELNCRCLDLDGDLDGVSAKTLLSELYSPAENNQLAYRNGQRFAARLVRFQDSLLASETMASLKSPFKVRLSEYGVLEKLQPIPMTRQLPQPGEVEIEVRAVGLNFRDVLNALGMLKAFTAEMGITDIQDLPFGGECAGVIAAVGEGVSRFQVGDAVIAAQTIGSLSSFVNVPADFVVPQPANLSFEEAATIPTAFLTAYYALKERAQLKPQEKVLIQSAAGGVGQAALQVAQWIGADVWGTASQPKWAALREMGVKHVLDSRSLAFSEQILADTDHQGVDVVLNSLNGEYIPHSLAALAANGRFVEIGKLGIWSAEQVAQQRPDVGYEPFDMLDISLTNPQTIRRLLETLMPLFEQAQLKPLNVVVYPIEQVSDAFRLMAQAKHIGKVVISMPHATSAAADKAVISRPQASISRAQASPQKPFKVSGEGTYLITGGLGALGLQVSQWLIGQGAK
ncbi:MAG: zinc-binding dehydrogenase, partial [Phormidesmis sp. RL_2_1]|nr:zinc-binding dehydrogenase [Phormidesmis sp. RL_2_1]